MTKLEVTKPGHRKMTKPEVATTTSEQHTEEGGRACAGMAALAKEEKSWMKTGEAEKCRDKGNAKGTSKNSNPTSLPGKSLLHEVPQTMFLLGSPSFWENTIRAATNNRNYIILTHARRLTSICTNSYFLFQQIHSLHFSLLFHQNSGSTCTLTQGFRCLLMHSYLTDT